MSSAPALAPALSIVVAVKDADANLPAIVALLGPAASDNVEVIFVVAGAPAPILTPADAPWRVVAADRAALIPHLWRDGVEATFGKAVAMTTAHAIPASDWVTALLSADLETYAGVGGTIDLDPTCSPVHRAIYALRYLDVSPPQTAGDVEEIAADNAVYRRADILAQPDLLAEGFWEPSFHRRFRAAGERLRLDPRIAVVYRGCERPADFARQRFAHGRAYGFDRASIASPVKRMLFPVMGLAVPAVLLARILRRMRSKSRIGRDGLRTLPWLLWFTLGWGSGEFSGYVDALLRRPRKG